jgi:AraC family transcriptional regulator
MGEAIDILYKRFYREWLPASEFEKADGPEMELYGGTLQKGYLELWMPVVKKE